MEKTKETAANIGASAKSGLEKTKANVQEKTDKLTAHKCCGQPPEQLGGGWTPHHLNCGNPNATGYKTGGIHR
ncbi:hypothetical protein RYX36_031064 [Vicia faba]